MPANRYGTRTGRYAAVMVVASVTFTPQITRGDVPPPQDDPGCDSSRNGQDCVDASGRAGRCYHGPIGTRCEPLTTASALTSPSYVAGAMGAGALVAALGGMIVARRRRRTRG